MTNKIFEALKSYIRHNQGLFISFCLAIVFSLWFFGCQSRTQSLLAPDIRVTEDELQVEYSSELRKLENELATLKEITEVRLQDLHRQDTFKQALFQNAMLIAETGNPNPLGILSLIGTIFGVGAVIDNRRKDGLIKGFTTKPPE